MDIKVFDWFQTAEEHKIDSQMAKNIMADKVVWRKANNNYEYNRYIIVYLAQKEENVDNMS